MKIYWELLPCKVPEMYLIPSYLECLYLENGSSFWAETFRLFLTFLGLPTVKISAKFLTLIEQAAAVIGRGLRAMPLIDPIN